MPFELFVALRYLLARRKQAFISVISLISTVGVAVGVMALVIALALMTGLQGELRDRILGSMAHVYVWKPGGMADYRVEIKKLLSVPGVIGAGPAIQGKGVISSGQAQAVINLKGIDPELEPNVTDIKRSMQSGSVGALAEPTAGGQPGILIGRQLAMQLGVRVGDQVSLLTTQGTLSPMGIMPRSRSAAVVGVFELGLQEFDAEWGFVTLEFARRLVGTESPELIQLRVDDIDQAPAIAQLLEEKGDGYIAQDWSDLNASIFSALGLEKKAMGLAIGLIMMVAALQIVASLILLVMEKSRDIGILKTMGTSARRISIIFMMQGTIIGMVGTIVGAAGGFVVSWVLDRYRLVSIPQDVYQIAHVPFVVRPEDVAIIVTSALVICFLATIYPSRQAAKLDPIQALRFE